MKKEPATPYCKQVAVFSVANVQCAYLAAASVLQEVAAQDIKQWQGQLEALRKQLHFAKQQGKTESNSTCASCLPSAASASVSTLAAVGGCCSGHGAVPGPAGSVQQAAAC
jgi:hypothetical protein